MKTKTQKLKEERAKRLREFRKQGLHELYLKRMVAAEAKKDNAERKFNLLVEGILKETKTHYIFSLPPVKRWKVVELKK